MRLFPQKIKDPVLRRKVLRRRLITYGSIVSVLGFAYWYQPVRIDLFPRAVPSPNPQVAPDPERLFSKGVKIAVVTAHPDDSEFYLGALLLMLKESGAELHHILLTDGDKGYYPWVDAEQIGRVRRDEQTEASTAWGAGHIYFLGFPDGRLRSSRRSIEETLGQLELIKPDYVFAFDSEYPPRASHGDHRAAGAIARQAIARMSDKPDWLLLYSTRAANYTFDVGKTWTHALDLLDLHKSQWTGEKLQRIRDMVAESWVQAGETADVEAGVQARVVKLN